MRAPSLLARHAVWRGARVFAGWTMLSRVFGFARDVLLASSLGTSWVADSFVFALRLVNFFRRLLAEGALQQPLIPLIIGERSQNLAGRVFGWLFLAGLVVVGVSEVFMEELVGLVGQGFSEEKKILATRLSRWSFIYLLAVLAMAWGGAVLSTHGHFGLAASSPLVLNVAFIAVLLVGWWLGAALEQAQLAQLLAMALIVAGGVQVGLFWRQLHRFGFSFWVRPFFVRDGKIALFLKRFLPTMTASLIVQFMLLIDAYLASLLGDGALSQLYYGDRLAQLPLAIIGIALGMALLPTLSRALEDNDQQAARRAINQALAMAALFAVPATIGLLTLAEPLIDGLFRRGALSQDNVAEIAAVLRAFAIGVPAIVMIKILNPIFFAGGDTKRPLALAMVMASCNLALALALFLPLGVVGLALATALAAYVYVVAALWNLYRRGLLPVNLATARFALECTACALAMGMVCLVFTPFYPEASTNLIRVSVLLGWVLMVTAFYFSALVVLSPRARQALKNWRQHRRSDA